MMCPENMKQLLCIISKLSNELDKVFNVKVIVSRSMVKGQNGPAVHRSHAIP